MHDPLSLPGDATQELARFFDAQADRADRLQARAAYYHESLTKLVQFHIPPGSTVLEIGCGTGDLLHALAPRRGAGIDLSPKMLERARSKYPDLTFVEGDAENLLLDETFDYVVLSDLVGYLTDVQCAFEQLQKVCHSRARIIVTHFNYLWQLPLRVAERLGLRRPQPSAYANWLSLEDLTNLMSLAEIQTIRFTQKILLPLRIPLVSTLVNRYLSNLPWVRKLGLVTLVVARPAPRARSENELSCSVIIPARNERGNIAEAVARMPALGRQTEIIFVEGNSSDGTAEEIERVIQAYPGRPITLLRQGSGVGKGDAVRKGFAAATGDILMILDADLTVPPEDLPKFFRALASGRGEFINGCRLVYPMEKEAMRFLNLLGNKFFGLAFSYLLDQRFKDTLCGTKVLYRQDYELLAAQRSYFGDFDPFGDFDLIFGAAKMNLKILELPVRYRERTYGNTQISRFRHGWLLLRMCAFALRKIKFI